MTNRKDFMISKLIDIVLSWTDDINLAIQEMVDEGIQPNELLEYFDANTIVEALSNNETPPEIAAINEKEKVNEIFDNADTLPANSELIENETNDFEAFKNMLSRGHANYRVFNDLAPTIEVYEDKYNTLTFSFYANHNFKEILW